MVKNKRALKKIVKEYVDVLKNNNIIVEKVILFGSFATGKQQKYSDIDLSIVSKDFDKKNILQRQEILGLAASYVDAPIEAIGYSPKEVRSRQAGTLIHEITKSGKVMYNNH